MRSMKCPHRIFRRDYLVVEERARSADNRMVGQPLERVAIVRATAVVRAFSRSLDEAARADLTSAPQHVEVYDILRFDCEGQQNRGDRLTREERPMKIVKVSAIPMSAPVPEKKRHRTDLGTKVKSDATLIRVETDNGLTGIGAALGTPPIVAAIVEHELAAECVDEDPMFSERIYERMYNGSRSRPALERGITQADESRRRGVIMEAIAGIDIAVWDVKAQALGIPLYQALDLPVARA